METLGERASGKEISALRGPAVIVDPRRTAPLQLLTLVPGKQERPRKRPFFFAVAWFVRGDTTAAIAYLTEALRLEQCEYVQLSRLAYRRSGDLTRAHPPCPTWLSRRDKSFFMSRRSD